MTTLDIPHRWLHCRKSARGWNFQCSVDLPTLVRTHRATRYFRQLVHYIEDQNQIYDYHMALRPNFRQNNHLNIAIYFGSPNCPINPPPLPVCISCTPTHELSMTSLISEQRHTRAWLDARGRSKLIVTPIRHVERLTELTDEDGEMDAFWQDAVDLIDREVGHGIGPYPTLALNHGTYRNHAHLHLKITFEYPIWQSTIALQYKEKLRRIKQLLKDPAVIADCFSKELM